MFPGTHPSYRGIKKQRRNLIFLRYSSLFIHLLSISWVPTMCQVWKLLNIKIIHSPSLFRADRSNDMAERTSDLGNNITIMKSSQRRVKETLSIRHGGIHLALPVIKIYNHVKVWYYFKWLNHQKWYTLYYATHLSPL